MPELPEVETFKRYFDSTSLNQKIIEITINDERILKSDSVEFIESITNKKFESTTRHGKNLFVKANSISVLFHFGMSGDFLYFDDKEIEPQHSRVLFKFENDNYLSYISQRLFGKVMIIESVKEYIKQKKIGPDALLMSYEEFTKALKRRSGNAKTVLMNQECIAGIGNIYSDEILFQTSIHPKTKINTLNKEKLQSLFENIKKVLNYGIEHEGVLSSYSSDYLIPHRDKKGVCPTCGGNIERLAITGRHGFFCPKCQRQE